MLRIALTKKFGSPSPLLKQSLKNLRVLPTVQFQDDLSTA